MPVPSHEVPGSPAMLLADRYRIVRPIGRGGMGEVYLAEHLELRRPCAIKMLPVPSLTDTDALARFRREAHNAARLSHPHIASIHDFGADGGRPFLVMEFVDGHTLAEEVSRNGAMPPELVMVIVEQIASAIAAAHAAGIVHRDLKPSNVMLARDVSGRFLVKLVDFGISRDIGNAEQHITTTDAVIGTPGFIAPEQFGGRHDDPLVDVYALGVLTVFLLHGEVPPNVPGLGLSIGPVADRHGWSEPLREALVGAVTVNRAMRWPDPGAFARALATALSSGIATVVAPHTRPGTAGAEATPDRMVRPRGGDERPAASARPIPVAPMYKRPATIIAAATLFGAALFAAIAQPWSRSDSGDARSNDPDASVGSGSPSVPRQRTWTTALQRSSSGLLLELRHPAEWLTPAPGPIIANEITVNVPPGALARLLPDSSALLLADLEEFAQTRVSAEQFAEEWTRSVGAGRLRLGPVRETANGIFQATLATTVTATGAEPAGVIQLAMQSAGGRTQVLWRALVGSVSTNPGLLTILSDSLHVVDS